MTAKADHKRILRSCHFTPTSGHFGITKTWRRISERFYWKGLYQDVVSMVSSPYIIISKGSLIFRPWAVASGAARALLLKGLRFSKYHRAHWSSCLTIFEHNNHKLPSFSDVYKLRYHGVAMSDAMKRST